MSWCVFLGAPNSVKKRGCRWNYVPASSRHCSVGSWSDPVRPRRGWDKMEWKRWDPEELVWTLETRDRPRVLCGVSPQCLASEMTNLERSQRRTFCWILNLIKHMGIKWQWSDRKKKTEKWKIHPVVPVADAPCRNRQFHMHYQKKVPCCTHWY